jgi:uncharacterized protein YjbI with pentapeptide repeats
MKPTIDMSNSADNSDVVASELAFSDCIAEGVHFDGARLTRIVFTRCDMYWASFFRTRLEDVTFDHCDLRGSDFKDAKLTNCRFLNCELGTDAIGGQTRFDGTDLATVEFECCRGW